MLLSNFLTACTLLRMAATNVLDFPRGDVADDTIRRTVRALMHGRGLKVEDLADGIGMQRSTLYRRLSGNGRKQAFAAGEVADIAAFFGVPVGDLYDGLGGRFTPPAAPSTSAPRTDKIKGKLPRLDSNQQPADYGQSLFTRPALRVAA